MKKLALLFLPIAGIFLLVYGFTAKKDKPLQQKNGLKLFALSASPAFANATIKLNEPANGGFVNAGKQAFAFNVTNFELGAQTPDAGNKMCANSAKGQHIHFIMDNEPYIASYSPTVETEVKPGHHVLLAFLSRSYHESIKQPGAYVLTEFNAGAGSEDKFDEKAPQIFYSRPKGEYIGDSEVQKLMIDFYLINCTLSPKGYKVRATVNGTDFLLTEWCPYYIEGLPLGDVKVKLELLDKDNNLVPCAYNGVERTCSLKTEPFRK